MTQQQYLDLRPIRPYLEQLAHVGSVSIPHDLAHTMQRVYVEIFGHSFNQWCQNCVVEALNRLMVEFDKYQQAGAPVILSAGQEAKTETNVTKRSRKRNSSAD